MPSLVRQSFRLGFLVAMLGLPLRNLAAQSGTIQGQVTDSSGGAVSGAIVTVEKTSLRVSTSASGRYTLRGVPARVVTVTVHAIGFASASTDVTVTGADVVEQNFTGQLARLVRGGKTLTDSRGKAVLAYRWDVRRRLTFRALTPGTSSATASWSRPVTVMTAR